MTELFIDTNNENKIIALTENGKLVEYYEEDEEDRRKEGNIYIGIVKDIVRGMQSAFVDIGTEKNAFIHLKDVINKVDETKEEQNDDVDISDILEQGQKILVQVKKDSNNKKGARVSTHINLPGRYIAYMPNTNIITVSQKIINKSEQERLINIIKENITEGNGAIIRTSAEGKTEELIKDVKKMEDKWNKIIGTNINPKSNKPQLLYKSEDIVEKILLDMTAEKIKKIVLNSSKEKKKIEEFIKQDLEYKNIKIEQKVKVLDTYDLEKQIEKLENRKIWLKCGGFITIDKTEALTAIDVNTGKYIGKQNVEQTIYRVNQEATIEIAKQLRLRDIGGIVIIDYIDMKKQEHRESIEELLKEELKKDRTKTQVEGFTKLDLMELTRKHICSHMEGKF